MEDIYYYKYIKYKKKYLELKQSGGMFNESRKWLDTYQQQKKEKEEIKKFFASSDNAKIQQEEDEKQLYGKDLLNIINQEIKKLEDLYNKYKKDNVITIPDIINIKNIILDLLKQIQVKNINELDNIIEKMTNIYGDEIVNSDNNISYFNTFTVSNKLQDLKNDVKNTLNKFPLLIKIFNCFYNFFNIQFVSLNYIIINNMENNMEKKILLISKYLKTEDQIKEEKIYGKELLTIIQKKTKELKNILYLEKEKELKNILEKKKERSFMTISKINYVNTIILDLLKQIKEKNIATRLKAEFTLIEKKITDLYSDVDNIDYYNNKNILLNLMSFIIDIFKKLESISTFLLLNKIFYYYYKLLGKKFISEYISEYRLPLKDEPMFQHNFGVSDYSLDRDYYRRSSD